MSSGLKRANSYNGNEAPSKKVKSTVTYVVSIIDHSNDELDVRSATFSKRLDALNYMRAQADERSQDDGFYKTAGNQITVGEAATFEERHDGDWTAFKVNRCVLDDCILRDVEEDVDSDV